MKVLNIEEQAKRCCRVCIYNQSPNLRINVTSTYLDTYPEFDTILSGQAANRLQRP